ncbi:MAG TPA: ABC transporter ATP-binding protein [Mycobacteriales bacterium]|nr:ABC transporter ATP-binding protein [Mycobacteriales bacterium]
MALWLAVALATALVVAACALQRHRLAALDERVLALAPPWLRDTVDLRVTPRRRAARRPLRPRWGAIRQTYRVERRLVGLLRPYRRAVLSGLGVTLLLTLTSLAQPWPTKILVDDALGGGSFAGLTGRGALVLAVAMTVALFLVSGVLGLLQTRLLYGLAQQLIADLRGRVFGHLTRLSLRFHDEKGSGDNVYRVANDTYAVQSVLLDGLVPLTSAFLTLAGTLLVLVLFDPVLALLALISVPAAAIATRRFGVRIRAASMDVQERESDVYTHAQVALGNIRTVQAFAREGYESHQFGERASASRLAMMRLITTQTLFGLAVDLVLALGLAVTTYAAASRALDGELTTGQVLVFLAYAGGLYGPVSGIAAVLGELSAASAAAERVFEVLDQEVVDAAVDGLVPDHVHGRIDFDGVDFSYGPGAQVLYGVSFSAVPGDTIALVGATGAGKSTLASLLLRLYDPDQGVVRLDGVDIRTLQLDWLREQIALVPQEPLLLPGTLRENIRYGRLTATDAEVDRAAAEANLAELLADPRGLDLEVGERGVTLSGGQRQRVAIARAFLRDAPVLVLDEPTSALDAGTEALVMDALERLAAGRVCLVIAHRLATVHRATRVLVLDAGRVVQQGTHQELSRQRGPYRALHQARFGRERSRPAKLVRPAGAKR